MTAPEEVRTLAGLRIERDDLVGQLQRHAEARHPRPDLVERLARVRAVIRHHETADLYPERPLALLCPGCGSADECRPDCPALVIDSPEGLF